MVGFSPDFKENFIKQSTAQQLCNNISMHKKTFENKKKQWKRDQSKVYNPSFYGPGMLQLINNGYAEHNSDIEIDF